MAKVGTIKERFQGRVINLSLNYSSKNKFSVTGIPEEVSIVMSIREVPSYNTEDEATKATRKLFKEYHEAIQDVTKVICYELNGSNHQVLVPWHGHSYMVDKLASVPDNISAQRFGDEKLTILGLKYGVYEKVHANGTRWIEVMEDGSNRNSHSYAPGTEIPWSEEAEAFFKNLKESINQGLMNLGKIIASTTDFSKFKSSVWIHTVDNRGVDFDPLPDETIWKYGDINDTNQ